TRSSSASRGTAGTRRRRRVCSRPVRTAIPRRGAWASSWATPRRTARTSTSTSGPRSAAPPPGSSWHWRSWTSSPPARSPGVSGSGTIQVDGTVGPIGGISHKIYAAHEDGVTEFLVPSANCAEAVQGAPDGIRLLEVSTLDGALDALDEATSGGQPPTCG